MLTSNFDRALEAAFEDAGRRVLEVFPGSRIHEASRAIQSNQPFPLKLRGDYGDLASRVRTLSENAREYGKPSCHGTIFNLLIARRVRSLHYPSKPRHN